MMRGFPARKVVITSSCSWASWKAGFLLAWRRVCEMDILGWVAEKVGESTEGGW